MASNGEGDDFLDWLSDIECPSLEQLLSEEDFLMAEPLNDGVSRAQGDKAQAPHQQSTQTAVATPHEQDNFNGTLESLNALNLEFERTIYMLKKAEAIRCRGRVDCQTSKTLGFKATNEPFSVLRIGRYEVRTQYTSHLTAKWYYTRKQLNWEILENGLKNKIEISWQDISAMRVEYGSNVDILEIELYKPPHFYCETEMCPKKHTSWKPSSDFTDGQACIYRRHHLEFPRGTLERNMEPLFFLDSRLRELARTPSQSPFFPGYIIDALQSSPPLADSELIQLHHHLHHQFPPNHSSAPASLADDELMILIQEHNTESANHQKPSLENSLASQISDYDYAPPPSLPKQGTIFTGQYMGHSPGEQAMMPSSYNSGQVITGTSHGPEGYEHNSNPNPMNFAHPWHNQGIFNQEMGHYPGFTPSSNATGMDVRSSSSYYPIIYRNHQSGHGTSHGPEGYDHNSNPNPMNFAHPWYNQGIFNQEMGHRPGFTPSSNATGMDVRSSSSYYPIIYRNHQSGQGGLIYPELGSNHYHNHQDHQYMVYYNTSHSLSNEHMNGDDEVRTGSCFWGDKPRHFMP